MARLFYSSNLSVDSYFWEARRLVDGGAEFSPRHAFIRAVAGQPPKGYERAVLDRGMAPPAFVASVGAVEADRERRQERAAELRCSGDGESLLRGLTPVLAEGVAVERQPIVGQGEFVWGYAVKTPGHPEGAPCSGLVAVLVSLIDGKTPVGDLLERLSSGTEGEQKDQVERAVLDSLTILYGEGAIEDLQSP